MHFAPPSSLPRAAVGYFPDSFFALSPRLIDRSRHKLCIPYRCFANRQKTHLTDHEVADAALHPMAGMVVTPIIHKKINCIQQLIIIINAS